LALAIICYFINYQNMEDQLTTDRAVQALAALAHDTRLRVFRLLVRQGPDGLPAGQIAQRLEVPPPTLSAHLGQLERAGLARSWRVERFVYYALDIAGTRRLLRYLTEDCCQGQPALCGALLAAAAVCP
jgi:DNA-binding transcriptional ArsR family regulator